MTTPRREAARPGNARDRQGNGTTTGTARAGVPDDAHRVRRYFGRVHDGMPRVAFDALNTFEEIVAAGDARIETDPEIPDAIPQIVSDRSRGASASVLVRDLRPRDHPHIRRDVSITVRPNTSRTPRSPLRCGLAVTIEGCAGLIPEGAAEITVARIVLRTAALHVALAARRARRIGDHAAGHPSEAGVMRSFPALPFPEAERVRLESLLAFEQTEGGRELVRAWMPTPWSDLSVIDDAHRALDPVPGDRHRTAPMLHVETTLESASPGRRRRDARILIRPATRVLRTLDPIDRLRALAEHGDLRAHPA